MKISEMRKEIKRLTRKRKIPTLNGHFIEAEEFVPNKKLEKMMVKNIVKQYLKTKS